MRVVRVAVRRIPKRWGVPAHRDAVAWFNEDDGLRRWFMRYSIPTRGCSSSRMSIRLEGRHSPSGKWRLIYCAPYFTSGVEITPMLKMPPGIGLQIGVATTVLWQKIRDHLGMV